MNVTKKSSAQNIVKGLLISSVIYFHAMTFVALPNTESVLSEFNILLLLFPFLMMVFFFYAGYNYNPGKRTPWQNIKRRSLQLLIPFGATILLSTAIIFAIRLPQGESLEALWNGILYFLMSQPLAMLINFPSNGIVSFDLVLALGILWFIYCLYICSIFFYLIVDYAIKKPVRLFSIITGLLILGFCLGQFIGPSLPYSVQCYPVVLAIMLFAAYLKKFNFLDKKPESKKDIVFIAINAIVAEAIIAGFGIFAYYSYGTTMPGALPGGRFDVVLKGYDAFIAFFIGILGTYVAHQGGRLVSLIPKVNFVFDWYGKHSSLVYLLHPICLTFIHRVIFRDKVVLGWFQPFLYVIISIVILVILFIIIDLIIKAIKNKRASKGDAA